MTRMESKMKKYSLCKQTQTNGLIRSSQSKSVVSTKFLIIYMKKIRSDF